MTTREADAQLYVHNMAQNICSRFIAATSYGILEDSTSAIHALTGVPQLKRVPTACYLAKLPHSGKQGSGVAN